MLLPANRLDPRVRTVWRISGAALALLGTGTAFSSLLPIGVSPAVPAVVAIAFFAPAALIPEWRYSRWRYEIRERDVFLASGVVFHTLALVPFDRIQYVETQQGPLDRMFGLTGLVVHTAGGRERIPGLPVEQAEMLREELSRIVGTLSV